MATQTTATPAASPPPTLPPLLRLPAELRNRIYELVLLKPNPIYQNHPGDHGVRSLLFTNRMIRKEASPIFYGQTEFDTNCFVDDESFASFLVSIGRNAKHIRKIHLEFPYFSHDAWDVYVSRRDFDILATIRGRCTNIKELLFWPPDDMSEHVGWLPKDLDTAQIVMTKQALAALDAELKTFPTLIKITVRVSSTGDGSEYDAATYKPEMEQH